MKSPLDRRLCAGDTPTVTGRRYADGSEAHYDHRVDPNEWHNVARRPENKQIIAEPARSLPAVNIAPLKGSTGLGADPSWRDRFRVR